MSVISLLSSLLVLGASLGTAQDTLEEFTTPDGALVVLEKLMIKEPGAPRTTVAQMNQRVLDLRAWLQRCDELELALGDHEFVKSLATYGSAGSGRDEETVRLRRQACMGLFKYAEDHEAFPEGSEVWDDWIARLSSVGFSTAFEESAWKQASQAVLLMVPRTRDQQRTIQQVMKKIMAEGGTDARPVRAALAVAIARSEQLGLEDKDTLFTRLYGGTGLSDQNRAKKAVQVDFVPFSGPSLDGGELSVADFKGKVLLIDYWATWCGPCLREMPNVVEAWKRFRNDDFAILGVSLDRAGTEDKIRSTMTRYQMDWPQIYEGTGWETKPARLNGVRSIPATYLLDREGNVVATNLRGAALEKKIAEVLAQTIDS
jgi:thiol-disulfide isomerase/thioredoxin